MVGTLGEVGMVGAGEMGEAEGEEAMGEGAVMVEGGLEMADDDVGSCSVKFRR